MSSNDNESRRLSAWENPALMAAFEGVDDHGEGKNLEEELAHPSALQRLSSTGTLVVQPTLAQGEQDARAKDPHYDLRKEIQTEIQLLDEREQFQSSINGADDLIRSSKFAAGLNKYFADIDEANRTNQKWAKIMMVLFGIVTTFVVVMLLLFVNYGYQDLDPVHGFVSTKLHGVGLARSPLMDPKDALLYDGHDVVVPPKEHNAVFLTTRSYQIGQQEHGQCVGLDKCTCSTPGQMCETDCPSKKIGQSGVFTGKCIQQQCEVTTWCPVLEVEYLDQSKTVNPFMKVSGVDSMQLKMTVNARFSKFQYGTQYNVTASVKELIRTLYAKNGKTTDPLTTTLDEDPEAGAKIQTKYNTMAQSGAILYVNFVYDCDIDRSPVSQCVPTLYVHEVDNAEKEEEKGGYGFKTVDYFSKDGTANGQTRRVRHLKGLRLIFDVTGRARQFNFSVMLVTLISGFGFAALAFIAVNEGRLLCESRVSSLDTRKDGSTAKSYELKGGVLQQGAGEEENLLRRKKKEVTKLM